jgi:hypothetical protein
MNRIDVHHHLIPAFYRDALAEAGLAEAGGRALPDWNVEAAQELMDLLGTSAAIVSVSTRVRASSRRRTKQSLWLSG